MSRGAVFCLGSPHLGANLEKGVNALGWALGRLPETRALGSLLNGRSVGNGCELSGLTHFDLLNHPAVYEQLRTWIVRPTARPHDRDANHPHT